MVQRSGSCKFLNHDLGSSMKKNYMKWKIYQQCFSNWAQEFYGWLNLNCLNYESNITLLTSE